jgi:hypothetical protein
MRIREASKQYVRRYAHAAFLLLVAFIAFRSAGCDYRVIAPPTGGSNGSGNGSGSGLKVAITPSTASIQESATVSLSAKVTGWTSDSNVSWSILSSGVGSLRPSGNSATYSAPAILLISPTLVTVRATSKEDTSRHADAVITITKQATDTSHSIALSISPITVTLKPGETEQFASVVTGTTNTLVLWMMISGPGSINATGLYTAPASLATRSIAVVRAIVLADTSVWKEATITITVPDTTPCFTRDIQPMIISNCTMSGCHSGSGGEARDLTTYSGVMSYVRAGHGSTSRIYTAITKIGGEDQMPPPPRQRLSAAQIDLIKRWIDDGATNTACPTDSTGCDTTSVSYAGFVAPTIQNYCLGCHSGSNPSGSIDLSTYNGVQTVAANGQLVGGITGTAPYILMPQSGSPLDACTIAKIRAWVTQGAKNN